MLILPSDKKSNNKKYFQLLIIFFLFLILFFVGKKYFRDDFFVFVHNISNNFNNQEIVRLQDEIFKLKLELEKYKYLEEYKNSLEENLNLGLTEFYKTNLIFNFSEKIYDSLIIFGGTENGLKDGAIVFNKNQEAIGFINKAQEKISQVYLYTKHNHKVDAIYKNASSSEEIIELIGDGAYGFLAYTNVDSQIKASDILYLAGNNLFKIGEVVSVENNENESSKVLRIRGFYSPKITSRVYVQK